MSKRCIMCGMVLETKQEHDQGICSSCYTLEVCPEATLGWNK